MRENLEQNRQTIAQLEDVLNATQLENERLENEAERKSLGYKAEINRLKKTINTLSETVSSVYILHDEKVISNF